MKEPIEGFDPQEIYNLFLTLGTVAPFDSNPKAAALPQRSGTCPDKTIKLLQRDYFLRRAKESNLKDYKRLIFCIKLQSMCDVFTLIYKNSADLSSEDIALLKRACAQFSSSIEKLRSKNPPIIDESEVLIAQALIELLHETLPSSVSKAVLFPPIQDQDVNLGHNYQPALLPAVNKEFTCTASYPQDDDLLGLKSLIAKPSKPSPQKVNQYLQYLIRRLGKWKLNSIENAFLKQEILLIYAEALKKLPVPTKASHPDPYWDNVPEKMRLAIIKNLNQLSLEIVPLLAQNPSQIPPAFLFEIMTFAITDKLARYNPHMHLEECVYDFKLTRLKNNYYFLTGEDNQRFEQLLNYFSTSQKKLMNTKKKIEIFDFHSSSIVLKKDDYMIKHHVNDHNTLGAHLRFIDKLTKRLDLDAEDYMEIIEGNPEQLKKYKLPPEYQFLQQKFRFLMRFTKGGSRERPKLIYNDSKDNFSVKTYQDGWQISWSVNANTEESPAIRGMESLDPEFDVPEITLSRPLPSRKSITENELILNLQMSSQKNLLNKGLTPAQISHLLKILYFPSQRAAQAMIFCRQNFHLFNQNVVQYLIEMAFLQDVHLHEALLDEPSFNESLKEFFSEMLARCVQEKSHEKLTYWVQLALLVGTHMSDDRALAYYEALIPLSLEILHEMEKDLGPSTLSS